MAQNNAVSPTIMHQLIDIAKQRLESRGRLLVSLLCLIILSCMYLFFAKRKKTESGKKVIQCVKQKKAPAPEIPRSPQRKEPQLQDRTAAVTAPKLSPPAAITKVEQQPKMAPEGRASATNEHDEEWHVVSRKRKQRS